MRGLSLLLSCFRAMAPKAAAKSTATVKAAAQKARKLQKAKASPKSKAKAVPDATGVVAVPDAQPITQAENGYSTSSNTVQILTRTRRVRIWQRLRKSCRQGLAGFDGMIGSPTTFEFVYVACFTA